MAIGEVPQPDPALDTNKDDMQGTELDIIHTDALDFEYGMRSIHGDDPALQEKLDLDATRRN